VAKYASKADCDVFVHPRTGQLIHAGRYWGVWRRELILAPAVRITATVEQIIRAYRMARRYLRGFRDFPERFRHLSLNSVNVIHYQFGRVFAQFLGLDKHPPDNTIAIT
jgi:hypothetical protein